jgi:hypothetical protein
MGFQDNKVLGIWPGCHGLDQKPEDFQKAGGAEIGVLSATWKPEKNYLIMKTVAAEHGELFGADSTKG